MKSFFYPKNLVTLAAAAMIATGSIAPTQGQPIPSPAGDSALPADIVPGTPLAEVVKMVQAGVDAGTINTYILNSQSAFNLDADQIIFLKDEGVPSDLINAMMARDKTLFASSITPIQAPVSVATSAPDTAPPPAEVDINYFDNTLMPYGSWVDVDGYGRCWRPTAVIYDAGWHPYCDRGHWVYTDYGWYWDSDYSWGVTFHYGRWFHHARFGWCWYPDTEWAPSWVTWRSGGEYCGWAPLPPFAVFRPGEGFFFRGARVGVAFDFGLDAALFTFVSPEHFCDRHPRSFAVPPARVPQIFRQTTVINNFNVNNRTIVNRGISVEHISGVTHRSIETVHVGALPNAGRQGWRGEGFNQSASHSALDNNAVRNVSTGNNQFRHGPALLNNQNHQNNGANAYQHESFSQPASGSKPVGNQGETTRSLNQNRLQSGVNNPVPSQKTFETQSRPINAATVPGHAVLQNEGQQNRSLENRSFEKPAVNLPQNVPPQHAAAQLEQRQFVAPSQPREELNKSVIEAAPRSYSPPAQPVLVPSQPRSAATGSGLGSDKQNH